ncbi:MAG TPA: polysaccharide deacetylase family protein [Acidimicrobiia bacterium]
MVTRAARIAAKALFAGIDTFFARLTGPRILLYHQVGTDLGQEMEVSLEVFQTHLDWIDQMGRVVDLETALGTRHSPETDRTFVITFDDGYSDVFRFAFPQLQDRGLPFTLYLNTRPLETGIPLRPETGGEPLTWSDLETMLDSGLMTVGAHTHSHVDVRRTEADALSEDLDNCDRLIERHLGRPPRHFAYPWGYWSDSAESLVRERYETAALAAVSSIDANTDPYRLPRIPIQKSDGIAFFKRKIRTGLRAEEWMRQRIKGYSVPPVSTTSNC